MCGNNSYLTSHEWNEIGIDSATTKSRNNFFQILIIGLKTSVSGVGSSAIEITDIDDGLTVFSKIKEIE